MVLPRRAGDWSIVSFVSILAQLTQAGLCGQKRARFIPKRPAKIKANWDVPGRLKSGDLSDSNHQPALRKRDHILLGEHQMIQHPNVYGIQCSL